MFGNFLMLVSPTGCWSNGPSQYVQRESASYIAASARETGSLRVDALRIGVVAYRGLPQAYKARVQAYLSKGYSRRAWEGLSESQVAGLVLAFHNAQLGS